MILLNEQPLTFKERANEKWAKEEAGMIVIVLDLDLNKAICLALPKHPGNGLLDQDGVLVNYGSLVCVLVCVGPGLKQGHVADLSISFAALFCAGEPVNSTC